MSTALSRLRRVREMTPAEIAFRTREKLETEFDRLRQHLGSEPMEDRELPAPFKAWLETTAAPRFYLPSSSEERGQARQEFAHHFPERRAAAVAEAERICRHELEVLGHGRRNLGAVIDWHRDPLSGRFWEVRFWADYDLVADHPAGDPKVVLEVNRHQHLPRLAKAYFLTGEEKYAEEALAQIHSWIDQNPVGLGVNWHSSLELGLRCLAWMWTLFFLLPSAALYEASARRIGRSLFAQLEHVRRYPSLFSSPNTHLIGEAVALWVGGVVFAGATPAAPWRRLGQRLLLQELDRQLTPEGVHRELSSYYHCYTLDFYLMSLALVRRNRLAFPARAWTQLARMMEFVFQITGPEGRLPLLGDDDGGRALGLARTSYREFPDALSSGAVLLGRGDFKERAGGFQEETFWLLGREGLAAYHALEATPPPAPGQIWPEAGYLAQRSDWSAEGDRLLFDQGGLGLGSGGHGHADALALCLAVRGRELLVDPGTFTYNGWPEWRDYFRSTRAHNTVVVDGLDQSEPGGTFSWRRRARTQAGRSLRLSLLEYAEAEHDGYQRLPQGVGHRRRLLWIRGRYWIVLDEFRGAGEHDFDLYYHFSRGAQATVAAGALVAAEATEEDARLSLRLLGSAPLTPTLLRGQTVPPQGWVSDCYGERAPASVLRASFRAALPSATVSFLVPGPAGGPGPHPLPVARPQPVEGGPGLAAVLRVGAFEDTVILSLGEDPLRTGDLETQAELVWVRSQRGVPQRLFALNLRRACYQGQVLFQESTPRLWYAARLGEGRLQAEDVPREV